MSRSELWQKTPEYILLSKIRFKLTLQEHQNDESLKTEFLDMVTRGNMTKYYEEACNEFDWTTDDELLTSMREANEIALQELETSENSPLESSKLSKWTEKVEFLCTIGDLDRAKDIVDRISRDESNSTSVRVEAAFASFRIALVRHDVRSMGEIIAELQSLTAKSCTTGSNWCCRNKLKAYGALYCLATRNFSRAATLLLDCVPTFESHELLPFKEVVEYTVLSGMVSLSRSDVHDLFNNNGLLQQALLAESNKYREYFYSLYDCRYKEFFEHLAWVESELRANPLLHLHCRYYIREMRLRGYVQLLQAYRTISLSSMATEFGVAHAYMEQEVARSVANGRLRCRIDKMAGTIVTVSNTGCDTGRIPDVSCERGSVYQSSMKRGDALLNRLKKLGRIIDF